MVPSPECLLEMKRKGILANEFLRRGERARYDELRKEADLLGQAGLSTREIEALYEKGKTVTQNRAYRRQFERYLAGEIETRDFVVGAPELLSPIQTWPVVARSYRMITIQRSEPRGIRSTRSWMIL